jgi:osmotically inducible lipoprotein OsmB
MRFGKAAEGEMKRSATAMLVVLSSLALGACGVTPGCRAVSTGALGAGTGAAIAAIAGGPVALGALVGGATGVFGGLATPPQAAYLGPSPICY